LHSSKSVFPSRTAFIRGFGCLSSEQSTPFPAATADIKEAFELGRLCRCEFLGFAAGGLVLQAPVEACAAVLKQDLFQEDSAAAGRNTLSIERKPMSVYTIYVDASEEHNYGAKPMDGDFKQVYPVGYEFDPNSNDPAAAGNMIRLPDRTYVVKKFSYQGLPVHLEYLPSKVQLDGPKRSLTDLLMSNNVLLVSDRFRSVVEDLEPDRHQFAPVKLVWNDGSPAADFFWFYPCARIDGMDRAATTHELHRERNWKHTPGGTYVVNLSSVGDNNIWIDPRLLAFDFPFVSDKFKRSMSKSGVDGIGYREILTTN
jgi:hypothetical protein